MSFTTRLRSIVSERVGHVVVALIIACLIAASTVLRPLDITIWSMQSGIIDREASGDIALVILDDAELAGSRSIARAIDRVSELGAEQVFVDLPEQKTRPRSIEAEFREGRNNAEIPIAIVVNADEEISIDRGSIARSGDREQPVTLVDKGLKTDFLGYVWGINALSDGELTSLGFALTGSTYDRSTVWPDYTIDPKTVPTYRFGDLSNRQSLPADHLSGKTIVITSGRAEPTLNLLKTGVSSSAMVHVLGAETLMRGTGQRVEWYLMLSAFAAMLLAGISISHRSPARRVWYGSILTLLFAAIPIFAFLGMRAFMSGTLAFFAIYALLRYVSGYKRKHLLIEQRSKLPNFTAMQRDLSDREEAKYKAIVVAKIARLDAVFAMLKPVDQARYLRQVAGRIALGSTDLTVYYDGGKYFAFAITASDYPDLQHHLDGLRAINCQPISVSDRQLDVSITMGVEPSSNEPVGNRLSSAIAAADQAREAYKPVFIIDEASGTDKSWDYSLQARLKNALMEDQIAIRLQPQICLKTMQIVAAEALARWHDVHKGEIPPADFVRQCERAGRLDELTKRVIGKTFQALETLNRHGHNISVSINVSAIQFVDHRIVTMVSDKLARSAIDPAQVTIEITETARIEDMHIAREALEAMKAQGMRLAMDDFGMASANLEPLLELPFDEIKIDQTFIKRMAYSSKANAIVRNAISLIGEAGMISVAEGIEDRATLDSVRDMGCDLGQGYYIARPLIFDELHENLDLQRDSRLLNRDHG
ncbi:MAG: GGDEF domain-containing phosphodiesterase [Pontixanthobacter sp.]